MPIYEFICEKCEAEFEEFFQGSSKGQSALCPKCGKKGTRKLFSSFAVSSSGGDGCDFSEGCGNSDMCRSCPGSNM